MPIKNSKRKNKGKISRKYCPGASLWGNENEPSLKKNYRPGQHGNQPIRDTNYGIQLKAKQKLKFYYGMFEKGFKNLFKIARKKKGDTSESFVGLLERRLLTVIYRANFAPTIFAARQIISHKQVLVNGKIVNIGSYLVKEGDVVEVREKSKKNPLIMESLQNMKRDIPSYLDLDTKNMKVTFLKIPSIAEIPYPVEMNIPLIVEFYSR
jgi:small subunit ribosomal protein S4